MTPWREANRDLTVMEIAGRRTSTEWDARKKELADTGRPELWQKTFDEFLLERVNTRYLEPMRLIAEMKKDIGEGFAVVALFCTLIEFLEGCEQGLNFDKNAKPGEPNKYGLAKNGTRGSDLFAAFLKREPLRSLLGSSAKTFYDDVRCGLLHEARTCGRWKVRTGGRAGVLVKVDGNDTILYRDELEPFIKQYLADYRARLSADSLLQANFITKWDHLSKP